MKDKYGAKLSQGDELKQVIGDGFSPAGTIWRVVDFGKERNGVNVCIVKEVKRGYIMAAYQRELCFFEKVEEPVS